MAGCGCTRHVIEASCRSGCPRGLTGEEDLLDQLDMRCLPVGAVPWPTSESDCSGRGRPGWRLRGVGPGDAVRRGGARGAEPPPNLQRRVPPQRELPRSVRDEVGGRAGRVAARRLQLVGAGALFRIAFGQCSFRGPGSRAAADTKEALRGGMGEARSAADRRDPLQQTGVGDAQRQGGRGTPVPAPARAPRAARGSELQDLGALRARTRAPSSCRPVVRREEGVL